MVDMGFSGPRYTWTNRREINNLIQERIDRVFMNPSWCLLYPDAKVSHLTRCHSDHCPILLQTNPIRQLHLTRPFKFQSFWCRALPFLMWLSKLGSSRGIFLKQLKFFLVRPVYGTRTISGIFFIKRKGCWLGLMVCKGR